jgi:Ras-related protein Rab-18
VSRREAEDWARSKGMLFVESSAKTKIGIQQVFNEVVQKVRAGRASQVLRA